MAVGDGALPVLHPVPGFRLGTVCAGIRQPNRRDLVIMALAPDSQVAGVFTRNRFCAAPVQVARSHLSAGAPRYWLVNTGNANAGTGEAGYAAALQCCQALASHADVAPETVLPFSTGVIGEPLPADRIVAALPEAVAALQSDGWRDAAEGIMTTDTRPKGASRQLTLDGTTVTLTGISKGAGMIRPDMATMLAFVATDAAIAPALLQAWLVDAVDASFHCITVDGDTSTNDAVMLAATGQSGVELSADHPGAASFRAALTELCGELARAVVADGEGATKFVTVHVDGARDSAEARRTAFTVAESPLVKTALFASDPNWGRILAAVGRARIADLDVGGVTIHLNDVLIAEGGGRAATYTEAAGQAAMQPETITIRIGLGRGAAAATVWTTDLSHDYVTINAEYRT